MLHSKSAKLFLRAAVIAVGATLLAWAFMHMRGAQSLEEMTFDIRVLAFAPATAPSESVVMVWLDDATMKNLPYQSPIPRDFLARLHRRIMKADPWLVAYDVFFKDPSFPAADKELIDAFEEGAAYAIVPRRPDGTVDMPLPAFREVLAGVGLADLPFNPFDSTVRKAKFQYDTDRGPMDSYAAILFRGATGVSAETAIAEQAAHPGAGPLKATPFVGEDEVLIRFAGPPGRIGGKDNAFKTYSAKLVEQGLIPDAWLRDKIVLVGASYEDLKDAFLTPYYAKATDYARMTGVEIHANILSSLMTNQLYFALKPWQRWSWVFLCAMLVAMAVVRFSPWRSAVAFLFVEFMSMVVAVAMFRGVGVVIPVVAPMSGGVMAFGAGLGLRALTEGRQKRFIKGVFARYVPAAVVERMTEHPELLRLGGETRRVTSLFTDIASFTSISERLNPETLVAFLNEYLGRMNEVLFANGATLDKYEGDAIIAFFNAPLDVKDHELAAVRSALGIRKASREITEIWRERCGREIVTRAGINSGPAVVGNMGSEGRFDYTAIGDTINLASRLEGANKFFNTIIMASQTTVDGLGNGIVSRPLDRVRVKGKSEPILLYEIVGERGEVTDDVMSLLVEPYLKAFDLFQSRNIDDAKRLFEAILKRCADDGPSGELLKRCERALAEPQWDLVTDLLSK